MLYFHTIGHHWKGLGQELKEGTKAEVKEEYYYLAWDFLGLYSYSIQDH